MNNNSKYKNPHALTLQRSGAFTLVELLIVIAVIAILAALLFPAFNSVVNHSHIQNATAEMHQLETAIDSYHAKLGFYPPSSGFGLALTNQLYYELIGTTSDPQGSMFTNLDNSGVVQGGTVANQVKQYFNVDGFMNCTRGTGDDAKVAQTFLPGLKPGEIAAATNGLGETMYVIITSVNSGTYAPMPGFVSLGGNNQANPWRYLNPGVNNPASYDLWIQIIVAGKTNLICNWKDQPSINSSLP